MWVKEFGLVLCWILQLIIWGVLCLPLLVWMCSLHHTSSLCSVEILCSSSICSVRSWIFFSSLLMVLLITTLFLRRPIIQTYCKLLLDEVWFDITLMKLVSDLSSARSVFSSSLALISALVIESTSTLLSWSSSISLRRSRSWTHQHQHQHHYSRYTYE